MKLEKFLLPYKQIDYCQDNIHSDYIRSLCSSAKTTSYYFNTHLSIYAQNVNIIKTAKSIIQFSLFGFGAVLSFKPINYTCKIKNFLLYKQGACPNITIGNKVVCFHYPKIRFANYNQAGWALYINHPTSVSDSFSFGKNYFSFRLVILGFGISYRCLDATLEDKKTYDSKMKTRLDLWKTIK